jgi:UDP-glucose 4-epimerase
MLSQAIRRLRKPSVAMPGAAVGSLGSVLRRARMADFSPEQLTFLTYGRGVDTTRMRAELGFEPRFTTASAFADFGVSLGVPLRVPAEPTLTGVPSGDDRG